MRKFFLTFIKAYYFLHGFKTFEIDKKDNSKCYIDNEKYKILPYSFHCNSSTFYFILNDGSKIAGDIRQSIGNSILNPGMVTSYTHFYEIITTLDYRIFKKEIDPENIVMICRYDKNKIIDSNNDFEKDEII